MFRCRTEIICIDANHFALVRNDKIMQDIVYIKDCLIGESIIRINEKIKLIFYKILKLKGINKPFSFIIILGMNIALHSLYKD